MAKQPQEKGHTETPAEMEARIRVEVEAKVRAEQGVKAAPAALTPGAIRRKAAAELAAFLKTLPETPRYRLTDKAYINDVLHEPESKPFIKDSDPPEREALIVKFEGRPGPHMVPHNEAARMMYKRFPPAEGDPIEDLSLVTGPGEDVLRHITGKDEAKAA